MITMKTGSKTPVRFTFEDGVSETTVTLQPDDDSGTLAAKMRRVLELEGGQTAAIQNSRFLPPAAALDQPEFTAADRAATEARLKAVSPLGWETANTDLLPEA